MFKMQRKRRYFSTFCEHKDVFEKEVMMKIYILLSENTDVEAKHFILRIRIYNHR